MRFLIIGAGGSGGIHTRELTARGFDVAVYDVDTGKAEALAASAGAAVASAPEVEGVDCAVVCAPGHLHRQLVDAQLQLGRKVVCEKPLSIQPTDAYLLAEHSGQLFIAESQAYAGEDGLDVLRMKHRLDAGDFGDTVLWRVCAMTSYRPQPWCGDLAVGGGAFIEGGIHIATVARLLFGKALHHFGSVRSFSGGTGPDTGTMVVDYEGGHQLLLQIGWGTEGCFDGSCAPLANSTGLIGSRRCEPWFPGDNHSAMWTHLLKCLTGDAEPVATLSHAAGAVGDIWQCYHVAGVYLETLGLP